MLKTCMNCRKYHATLNDEQGHDFHIHDWCEQWNTTLDPFALADQFEYNGFYNSDLETGEACCYMFEPAESPAFPDEWFLKNKEENERKKKPIE